VFCGVKKLRPKKVLINEKGEAEAEAAERVEHCTRSVVNIATGNTSMTIDFDSVVKIHRNLTVWVEIVRVFVHRDIW
jgi:hypothetical protein